MERAALAKQLQEDLRTAVLNRCRCGHRLKPGLEDEADLDSAIEWEAYKLAQVATRRFDALYDDLVREAAGTFTNEEVAA